MRPAWGFPQAGRMTRDVGKRTKRHRGCVMNYF
jgi:hypothetical protein